MAEPERRRRRQRRRPAQAGGPAGTAADLSGTATEAVECSGGRFADPVLGAQTARDAGLVPGVDPVTDPPHADPDAGRAHPDAATPGPATPGTVGLAPPGMPVRGRGPAQERPARGDAGRAGDAGRLKAPRGRPARAEMLPAGAAQAETAAVLDPEVTASASARPPAEEREAERGLRGLVGSGSSQVGPGAALRARDAARPTIADLTAAEQNLVIVRRNWVPRESLPGRS